MTELLNPIAEQNQPDSGIIVTPTQAYSIKVTSKFFCPDHDCKDPRRVLIPAKSKLNKHFFKHRSDFSHEILPETLLHKMAVKWFENCSKYELPKCDSIIQQTVDLDNKKTKLEFRRFERIIPDVKLTTINNFTFAIEIVVTSDIKAEKNKLIQEFNLPTVRVDLSKFYTNNRVRCRTDYHFVSKNLNVLLTDNTLKSWVISPIDSELKKLELKKPQLKTRNHTNRDNQVGEKVLLIIGVIILFISWIKPMRPKGNKRFRKAVRRKI